MNNVFLKNNKFENLFSFLLTSDIFPFLVKEVYSSQIVLDELYIFYSNLQNSFFDKCFFYKSVVNKEAINSFMNYLSFIDYIYAEKKQLDYTKCGYFFGGLKFNVVSQAGFDILNNSSIDLFDFQTNTYLSNIINYLSFSSNYDIYLRSFYFSLSDEEFINTFYSNYFYGGFTLTHNFNIYYTAFTFSISKFFPSVIRTHNNLYFKFNTTTNSYLVTTNFFRNNYSDISNIFSNNSILKLSFEETNFLTLSAYSLDSPNLGFVCYDNNSGSSLLKDSLYLCFHYLTESMFYRQYSINSGCIHPITLESSSTGFIIGGFYFYQDSSGQYVFISSKSIKLFNFNTDTFSFSNNYLSSVYTYSQGVNNISFGYFVGNVDEGNLVNKFSFSDNSINIVGVVLEKVHLYTSCCRSNDRCVFNRCSNSFGWFFDVYKSFYDFIFNSETIKLIFVDYNGIFHNIGGQPIYK